MKVAIFGYGTVGKGLEKIIDAHPDFNVEYIFVRKEKESLPKFTNDLSIIDKVDIIFECLNGLEPANEIIRKGLMAKKCVITSNKMVVANYLDDYLELSNKYGGILQVEACVAGGIPFIDALLKLKDLEDIKGFVGIFNGTSNFILDSMFKENMDFNVALSKAQELGYAEKDPTNDIEGIDVMYKTMIATSIAYSCKLHKVNSVTGISKITKQDIDYAKANNKVIKQLALSKHEGNKMDCLVIPCFLDKDNYLANIPLNYNGQLIYTNSEGSLGYYGQGAGSMPTASAMVLNALDYKHNTVRKLTNQQNIITDKLIRADFIVRSDSKLDGVYHDGYYFFENKDSDFIQEIKNKDSKAMIAIWRMYD